MTYEEMTRDIRLCNELVDFMYDIQKEKFDADKEEDGRLCGKVINTIIGYKNYLQYEKQYQNRE